MTVCTRLNPTCNGPLHIGHLYMALVNRAEAHAAQGRFLIRMDDNQPSWLKQIGAAAMAEIGTAQLADLAAYGVQSATPVVWQSELEKSVRAFLAGQPHFHPVFDDYPLVEHLPRWVGTPAIQPFCLMTYITAERVVLDHIAGVTLVIRGHELISETALYQYFCYLFGFSVPKFVYLPRLRGADGGELADISKTAGNWKLRDLLARWSAQDIIYKLSFACLKEPDQPWRVANVKPEPRLTDAFSGC